jgi:hypothetical protein
LLCLCGGSFIMSQDRAHITFSSEVLIIRYMLTCTSHSAFVIKMLQLKRDNSSVNIQSGGYPKEICNGTPQPGGNRYTHVFM